jgi:hypothetical protein
MIRLFAILATALIIPFAAGNAFGQAAYVHEMSGSVTGNLNSVSRALKTGDIISSGTVVSTGERSHAVIKFEDGQIMALAERSSFRIVEYRYIKERVRDSNMVFALLQGGLRFITGMIGATNRNAFRMTAGTATIGIRGTDATVIYDPVTQTLTISVRAGEVTLSRTQGIVNLGPGQTFGEITPAIQRVLDFLATQGTPVNLPVSVPASAAAAAAAAEAARLAALADAQPGNTELRNAANAAAEAAQKALAAAIAAAVEAYDQAIQGGALRPDLGEGPPTGVPGAGGSGGVGAGGSVSPN